MRSWIALFALCAGFLAAGPVAHADGCQAEKSFSRQLDCWKRSAGGPDGRGGGAVLVGLRGAVPLGDAAGADFAGLRAAFNAGPLVVSVPAGRVSGPGGTVLLILATRRLVSPEATISRLDPGTVARLKAAQVCGPGNATICDQVAKGDVRGQALVAAGLVKHIDEATSSVGAQAGGTEGGGKEEGGGTEEGGGDGGGNGLLWTVLIGALVLLAAAVMFVFLRPRLAATGNGGTAGVPRRSPQPSNGDPPRSPQAPQAPQARREPVRHRSHAARPSNEPRRTATLRTDLHPQGYVEVDRCLFRAAWADPDTPPPALGEPVDVVQGTGRDSGLLLAYPSRTRR